MPRPTLISRLRSRLAGFWGARSSAAPGESARDEPPLTIRRWQAARTDRLNKAHWQEAHGQPINADLQQDLPNLRARSSLEASRNPMVEGVIHTHSTDVVGPNGPLLSVHSSDETYNRGLKSLYQKWSERPEITGKLALPELLKLWIRALWTKGEILATEVSDMREPGPVKYKLKDFIPERLATPPQFAGDRNVALGVRRDEEGRPQQYYISKYSVFGPFAFPTWEFDVLPADMVLHEFIFHEADQCRGFPWLSTSLQQIADLRDYDDEVLDAARQAADQAVFWSTDHPEAPFVNLNEETTIERRTQSMGPPGWTPNMLNPTQPATQYVDYRREKLAELGRPVSMPLMIIRLDSSGHSFATANFDGKIYVRCLQSLQGWLERRVLNRTVLAVAREAELARVLPPRPADLKLSWTWPVPPHVDPVKEAVAERMGLENGTLDLGDAIGARGDDLASTIAKRKRTKQLLEEAGLPQVPVAAGSINQDTGADPGPEEEGSQPPAGASKQAAKVPTPGRLTKGAPKIPHPGRAPRSRSMEELANA